MSYFTKLLIVINNWNSLREIVFNSFNDSFSVIITSSAGFSSFHASLFHEILWNIVVKNLENFDNRFLKVLSLVKSSWETINQIVLNKMEKLDAVKNRMMDKVDIFKEIIK
jgi:hypothetical protein